jgi:hypothetical protein
MIAVLTLLLATAAPVAPRSVFFEQTSSSTVDGQAGPALRSRVYWRGHNVRLEFGDLLQPTVLLLDLQNEHAVRLDPAAKTAAELDMAALRAQTNLGFSMAGDAVGDENDRFRTTALEGTRTIAGFVCHGHRIRSKNARVDVWTGAAVPVPMQMFEEFLDWSGAAQSLGGLLPEIQKLPGFPLETRSRFTVSGHVYESVATITVIKTEPLADSLFVTPKGYRAVAAPDPADAP